MIDDIVRYHRKLKDPINRLIDIHSTWGNSLIMEGWAIYPENIAFYPREIVSRVWIIAAENLLRARLRESASFRNASVKAKKIIYSVLYGTTI